MLARKETRRRTGHGERLCKTLVSYLDNGHSNSSQTYLCLRELAGIGEGPQECWMAKWLRGKNTNNVCHDGGHTWTRGIPIFILATAPYLGVYTDLPRIPAVERC